MLSGILKNEIAVKVSISIIRVFAEMRKFIYSNGQLFERLTNVEVIKYMLKNIYLMNGNLNRKMSRRKK